MAIESACISLSASLADLCSEWKMPLLISNLVKGRIFALGQLKWSRFMIQKQLRAENFFVSTGTISNVLRNVQGLANVCECRERKPRKRTSATVRTSKVIKIVKQMTESDNPKSQRVIGLCTGVSQPVVSRIISEDLGRIRKKKVKQRYLTDAMIEKRRFRAEAFAELVTPDKAEYILTLDEAMLQFDHTNGQTEFFYTEKEISERLREAPLKSSAPQFPQQVMFVCGFTWRGQTRFYHIPLNSKMTAEVFIREVLSPIMLVDLPKLYGKKAHKVVLHMDSATSHTAQLTIQWLKAHGFQYITKDQWLPNSPEISPMDFFANGYLKSKLVTRRYTTIDGMLRCAKQEWMDIPLEMFRNALSSWSDRVKKIFKAKGHYVPQ